MNVDRRYPLKANIDWIVGEIDAEIEKLQRVRAILGQLLKPQSRPVAKPHRVRIGRLPEVRVQPEPQLMVLPPKARREYSRRVKQAVVEPRALAAPLSNRPLFVPRPAAPESPSTEVADAGSNLEAVMRQRLLGGAA